MSELRMIRISISTDDGEGNPVVPSQPKPEEQKDNNGKTKEAGTIFKSIIIGKGLSTAKRLILQGVDMGLERHFSLTEDYIGETTYSNAKNIIGKVTSIGSSLVGSAMAGATIGGGIGAIVSAGITAVGIGVSEVMSINAKVSQTFRSLNASNYEMNYARLRAGLVDGSQGTEN